ncbi:prolipoprotein diacylglyceryl transferase [Neomoorella thermoacetica]|uniref:Phosphatidylglycerol--prolipoprotein diacylglyceryl transferase n=2 Tax=Neomoorella thermoacetica TaxID=1525 RepID=A0A1D7X7I8_NEOTH|nr:prolipoprotein diacylglyceryl transferase [Moorella thermoacetica]AKX93210.1 prolipoprotein diacylglyceryl transferase [Moorella thermoacetica]AKX95852.1 prolipoprotein diacylglyceryl transferase [Moorella thermoacetica]AOQ22874.1 Prolipoprotein diacylglyceryl transferase [Moorella thermoacetica]APC07541.1 prolipoprotein diacylglyceryl transferase [Moorella thermoacetica]OIQ08268.1 prolipoprotein diacylglyceryl transferase [Moorella thermoacetica]
MLVDLNPIAFHLGPLAVRWYGIFMALSFLVGSWYLYREGLRRGLDEDFLLNLAIIVIISGVIGARLVFVLANYPGWFLTDRLQILKIYEGGLSWHGGLLGGFLAGWLYARSKRVDVNQLADMVIPGLAFGYFLVRIANIFNQEVLGRPTDFWFGRWPAQLIGSAIGLILLARYFYVQSKNPPSGYQFWSFIFYHQILRAVIEESVRDNPLSVLGYVVPHWGLGFFTLTQVTTPPILILAYYFMWRSRRLGRGGQDSYRLDLTPR